MQRILIIKAPVNKFFQTENQIKKTMIKKFKINKFNNLMLEIKIILITLNRLKKTNKYQNNKAWMKINNKI